MVLQTKFVEKIETGITGFDLISNGGLPKDRITLVSGSAGSAKTVFAAQFLAEGIRKFNEGGVFVTFEETPDDIRRNLHSLGWDIVRWETEGNGPLSMHPRIQETERSLPGTLTWVPSWHGSKMRSTG